MVIHHGHTGIISEIQGGFKFWKSINVVHYIDRRKEKDELKW
jgi:hypothetical protein